MKVWERLNALEKANTDAAQAAELKAKADAEQITALTKRLDELTETIEDQLDLNGDGNGVG